MELHIVHGDDARCSNWIFTFVIFDLVPPNILGSLSLAYLLDNKKYNKNLVHD